MNPEAVIAGLIGLINSLVPEPYAGKLIVATRDYFAVLGQQSAEAAKTAAAKENAAAVVNEILPTIVDSPLSSDQPPAISNQQDVSRDAERSEPATSIQQPASPEPTPAAPAPDPKPEPPKKNNGRNQAPVF